MSRPDRNRLAELDDDAIDRLELEDLANVVVAGIDLATGELLLAIDEHVRLGALYRFRESARAGAPEIGQGLGVARLRAEHDWRLSEQVFEPKKRYREAAAHLALAHDQVCMTGDRSDLFGYLIVRHKLWWNLSLTANVENWGSQLIEFAVQTAELLETESQSLTSENLCDLKYLIQDRTSATLHIAQTQAKTGDLQQALQTLDACRPSDFEKAEPDTREAWHSEQQSLRLQLGADLRAAELKEAPAFIAPFAELLRQIMSGNASLDESTKIAVLSSLQEMASQSEAYDADRDLRHGFLLSIALLLHDGDDPGDRARAEAAIAEARSLEAGLDGRFRLRRRALQAKLEAHKGDPRLGASTYQELFDGFQNAEERLHHTSEYLLALGKIGDDLATIVDLVRTADADLETVLADQPLATARRRVRDIYQRAIEAGVFAIASTVSETGRDKPASQEALAWAWRLLMRNRNVELHWQADRTHHEASAADQEEAVFHERLRKTLIDDDASDIEEGPPPWLAALEVLHDAELVRFKDQRSASGVSMKPHTNAVSVAYCPVRDLATTGGMVVLSHADYTFDLHFIEAHNIEQQLIDWAASTFPVDPLHQYRGLVRDSEPPPDGDLADAPGLSELIPRRLVLMPQRSLRLFPILKSEETEIGVSPPISNRPWLIYPGGALGKAPIEMLPDTKGATTRFGQRRAVSLCLRPTVPNCIREPVSFQRGWLGLGGVPTAGSFPLLPGSIIEIAMVAELLQEAGFSTRTLLEACANADQLQIELTDKPPAVLHLAVHGFPNEDHPEACVLILADFPSRPERELLTYRKIGELPLDGVELVVLSACSGLIGRSGRSASMEGLVWAFLRRGVPQVVASRYPVDDEATATFMITLYEQLLHLPVADALGVARDVCLTQGMPPREVGAWSVWC